MQKMEDEPALESVPLNRAYVGLNEANRHAGLLAALAESTLLAHLRRSRPAVYYIKAEGEVDAAYVEDDRFWPVELKWTRQLRPKDLKQIAKYPNGLIAGRVDSQNEVAGVPVLPAPVVLLRAAP